MDVNYPLNLIRAYLNTSHKLKKFERVLFKKITLSEVSNEFLQLASTFQEYNLFQYAAMCYLGAAKCEKFDVKVEVEYYIKAGDSFLQAELSIEKLNLKSNSHECIEGTLKCYNTALSNLKDESPMKAALIRKIKKISSSFEGISNFTSPCHRIYDLETSAKNYIDSGDYIQAMERLTDICDNIKERKVEKHYEDVLSRIEITRILLLIVLELPAFRNSPSQIKLLETYSNIDMSTDEIDDSSLLPFEVRSILSSLIIAWLDKDKQCITDLLFELLDINFVNDVDKKLINYLIKKYFV